MAGLTTDGFVVKTFEELRAEIEADTRAIGGDSVPLGDNTFLGQFIAIIALIASTLWELGEAINAAQDPDSATGANLESIAAYTGTLRLAAAPSTVDLTLTGTPATAVPTGSGASTLSTSVGFVTTEDVTIALLTSWAITTAYVVGDRVTNAARCYECITAGTSAGSGGPTTTSADETDGTAHWRYLGEGTGAVDAEAASSNTGPLVALSGDITVIDTPVSGWSSVVNLLDALEGRDIETDELLRVRREDDLFAAGTSPLDAIRSALLDVDDVTTVTVFQNTTDVTDADGVPPHSVEALVQGGADQDIWDALLANVAAGIGTHGTESGTATDSAGNTHTVKFSRPTAVTIHVDVTLTYDADDYPTDGDTQIKAAIVAGSYADISGRDARASAIASACFAVAGVLDVTPVLIGTADPPVASTTIAIGTRQIAFYDSTNVDVTSSAATP